MNKLQIEYIPIKNITPYENNARKHDTSDIEAIAKSIIEFGFDDVLGIWGENNIIVEGHGRLLAAKKLGMDKVPCVRLDHLTDEQRRAYALAHNKTAELSMWDFDTLADELADIADIDMSDFGFDVDMSFDDTTQTINSGGEIDLDSYDDDKFECECPKCGFKFNRKK